MKKFYILIFTFAIQFLTLNAIEIDSFAVIQVVTPTIEVYDDGLTRVQYSEFSVLNYENKELLKCGKYFDTPAKIEIPIGTYKFKYKDSNSYEKEQVVKIDNSSYKTIILK
jgi:hypothetical protein